MFRIGNPRENRLDMFWHNIQLDLRLFLYVLAMLCLYRVLFMAVFHGYIGEGMGARDILMANWMGLRLSLKTAGWAAAVPFLFLTLFPLAVPRFNRIARKLRIGWGTLVSFFFTLMFIARFPYYEKFHGTYNAQMMAGTKETPGSVLSMMISDYGLIWRMAIVIAIAGLCYFLVKKILHARAAGLPRFFAGRPLLFAPCFLVAFALFFLFVRFGGSFGFAQGINWESASVTSDDFLNECVLDDGQALYRVFQQNKRMKIGIIAGVDKANIRAYAQFVAGHSEENGDDLTPYLARQAKGPRMQQPRHIFIILEEAGAAWPTMDKYADLHIADGIKSLMAAPNGYTSHAIMPNGEYTSLAFCGLISGLNDMKVSVNSQPRSLEEAYPTAFAAQLKKLGYTVDFWYGGMPNWENMNHFALAQGFDHFYGYPDMHVPKVNTFGTSDEYIFHALAKHLDGEPPTVHVIKTASNHPPYNVDLEAEGFDLEHMKELTHAMPDVENPDQLAKELGHYWYMDKIVTNFIKETEAKYPDSLFIVTGDHAVRTDPNRHPTLYEHQAVVFLLYGAGVTKDILPPNAAGGLTNFLPTLMELFAPKGFTYYSIVPSLTEAPDGMGAGFNTSTWLTQQAMGRIETDQSEALPWTANGTYDADAERAKAMKWLPAVRTISWWMVTHGTDLNAEQGQ